MSIPVRRKKIEIDLTDERLAGWGSSVFLA
jgi:hypothetical protein